MTKLSVNINKIATIRNARGNNLPDLIQFAKKCEKFGAQGITIHPRPDERHITRKDVYAIKPLITTEYNIEGYPGEDFLKMVIEPIQALKATISKVAHSLINDHTVYMNADSLTKEETHETYKKLRDIGAQLYADLHVVPLYKYFRSIFGLFKHHF